MKNKRNDNMSNIMPKRHSIFTENFTIFFSNAGKIRNVPQIEFDKS